MIIQKERRTSSHRVFQGTFKHFRRQRVVWRKAQRL